MDNFYEKLEEYLSKVKTEFTEGSTLEPFRLTYQTKSQLETYLKLYVLQIVCVDVNKKNVRQIITSTNQKLIEDFKGGNSIVEENTSITKRITKKTRSLTNNKIMNTFDFLSGTTYTFSNKMIYKIISMEEITKNNLGILSEKMKSVSDYFKTNRNR